MCRGTIINISDASHQEVQHLTLWQSYNMDTSITLEIFWLYTKARKGWQIDNWCLHDKKSGHKWTYINSFYKKKLFFTWLSTSIAMSMNMSCSSLMEVSNLMMSACLASMSANVCFAAAVSMMIPCKQVMPDKKRMKGKNEWSNSCIGYMYLIQPEGQKYLYNCTFDPFSLFLQSDPFTNNTLHI